MQNLGEHQPAGITICFFGLGFRGITERCTGGHRCTLLLGRKSIERGISNDWGGGKGYLVWKGKLPTGTITQLQSWICTAVLAAWRQCRGTPAARAASGWAACVQLAAERAQPDFEVAQLGAGLSTSREEKVPALALAKALDTPFQLMTSKKAAM